MVRYVPRWNGSSRPRRHRVSIHRVRRPPTRGTTFASHERMTTRLPSDQTFVVAAIALTKRGAADAPAPTPDAKRAQFRVRAFAFGLSAHLARIASLPSQEVTGELVAVVAMLVALARAADDREEAPPMVSLRIAAAGDGCHARLFAHGPDGRLAGLFQPTLFASVAFTALQRAIPSHLLSSRYSPGAVVVGSELSVAAPVRTRTHGP